MSPLECDLQVINSDAKILITAKERFENMNSGIYLVVETPRAGRLGHRYIRSSNVLPTEQSIVDIFTKAGMNPVGANYISVSMSVTQTLPGSVRQGNERIVLIGVNTQKVDIVKIKAALQKLFVPLDQLIKDTDCEKESNKIGVWFSGIFQPQRNIPKPSADNKSDEQYAKLLKQEFGCTDVEFKNEMKSYIVATTASAKYDDSKLEDYAKSFFNEKNSDKLKLKTEKYAFVLNGSDGNFKSYYNLIQGKDQKEIRKNIHACYKKFTKLRKNVLNNEKLNNDILEYKTINFGICPDLIYEEPKTPLYNNTDKHILESFNDWFNLNKTSLELTNIPSDFSEYILNLNKNNKTIVKELDRCIALCKEDASVKKKLKNDAFLYYLNDAKEFVTELCKLAPP